MSNKDRGAVLIMTMMAICLTFMMVYVLIQTTGFGLNNTSDFYARETALQAAQSGVDYAVTRLQQNSSWRGDSNCKYWNGSDEAYKIYGTFNKGFMVAESNGNVVGLLKDKSNHITGFRIKFSYETNSADTYDKVERNRFGSKDTTDEYLPATTYRIQSPYVSVNNLISKSATLVYRANSNGIGIAPTTYNMEAGQEINDTKREFAFHLPAQRISLVVEGLSGNGLRDCQTPAEINAAANGDINIVHRYIETSYSDIAPIIDGDAAFAKESIDIGVQNKIFVSTNMQTYSSDVNPQLTSLSNVPAPGSLRSKNSSIIITGGKLNTYNGKLIRPKDVSTSFNQDEDWYTFLDSNGKPQQYQFPNTAIETSNSTVEDIDWKHVAKAENQGKANNVTPGYYQWHIASDSTAANPTYQLRYYEDGYQLDDMKRPVPQNADNFKIAVVGEVPPNDPGVEINGKKVQRISIGPSSKVQFITDPNTHGITEPTLSLSGKLFCQGDFTIGSDVNTVNKVCPKVLVNSYIEGTNPATPGTTESSSITSDESNRENGVFTATGDIFIASSLYGSGAIVTEKGNVTFMGSSVLESGNCGVAIFGKNVTIKSLEVALNNSPQGKQLNHDISHDPVTDNAGINKDGSRNVTPKDDYFNYLHESWQKNKHYTPSEADVESYFAKLGARVQAHPVISIDMPDGKRCYVAQLNCLNSCNNDINKHYTVMIDEDKKLSLFEASLVLVPIADNKVRVYISPNRPVPTMNIPSSAVLPIEQEATFNDEAQKIADIQGSVCYGDQTFKGVIYARENFNADLGDKFSLTVTGAIRAEKGSITATCKSASFAYDETYIKTLMPTYSKLICKMWNCW